jgi:hypothetical protein
MSAPAGLAHVATASFLASRAVPSGGFAVALAGGVALARAAQRRGLRSAFGVALAAMLQTVAIMGPARISVPLTQALSAPVLGRMEARERSVTAQVLVAAAIRIGSNVTGTFLYVWILLGLDAYTEGYERLIGWLPFLPDGQLGALLATALGIATWTVFASIVQVLVYRRGLQRWPSDAPADAAAAQPAASERDGAGPAAPVDADHPRLVPAAPHLVPSPTPHDPPATAPPEPPGAFRARRFDPRAVAIAAIIAFAVLLSGIAWPLLAAVSAWLAAAWLAAHGDRAVVRAGLALTALLAGGTLVFGLIGGLGIEVTLQRTTRAALLVLVATWLRYAAGEAGLREVFRRALHRLRRIPGVRETSGILDGLGTTSALAASGRRLLGRLQGVPADPLPIADAVLDWVQREAGRRPPDAPPRGAPLRAGGRDGALVALVAIAGLTLPLAAG